MTPPKAEERCALTSPHGPHHIRSVPPYGYRGSWKGKNFCSFAYPTATTSECNKRSHICSGVPASKKGGGT
jgi:hypothetical protein